jgi:hypothetical protein
MDARQLQDAKARSREFLDAALKKGERRPNNKELLLGPGPRFDDLAPRRGAWKRRASLPL